MNRLSRRTALLAAVAVAVPTFAAACGGEQSKAGAAATVGASRITTDQLSARVERALAAPGVKEQVASDRSAFERRILTLLVDSQLVAAVAKKQNVSVSDGEVETRYQDFVKRAGSEEELVKQGSQAGIPKPDLKPYFRDLLLTEKIGDKLLAGTPVPKAQLEAAYRQNFVQVRAAHILVKDKALSDRLLAQVRAEPSSFAALAKKHSTDASKTKGGDLGTQSPSQYVAPFAAAVSTGKVGSFVQVKTSFGYHVIRIISRKATKTLAAATPEIRAQLQQETRQRAIGALLAKESKELGVTINPRFGSWNATKGTVEPPKSELSTPAPGSGSGSAPAPSPSAGG